MKNVKSRDEFINEELTPWKDHDNSLRNSNKTPIEDFMKKYPVGTTFKTKAPNGEYTRKVTGYNPKDENDIICDMYDPNGKLWKKDARSHHGVMLQSISKGDTKVLPQTANENMLPRPYKKIKCLECGEEVCDSINYKIGHLYNKHNCKPSVGDYKAKSMMKKYFA